MTVIGAGDEGVVWEARWEGRPVAVKVAAPEVIAAEVATLRRAGPHPHLPEVVASGAGWLALSPGVGDITAVHPWCVEPVRVVRAVAGALARLHAVGAVHGAVTADNVVIDDDGGLWLCDCGGLAPPAPAAPELAPGDRPTPASDVWALGSLALSLGVDTPLVRVAVAADPRARPPAEALTRVAVGRRHGGPLWDPPPGPGTGRRTPARRAVGAVVAAGVVVGVVVGAVAGGGDRWPPPCTGSPPAAGCGRGP